MGKKETPKLTKKELRKIELKLAAKAAKKAEKKKAKKAEAKRAAMTEATAGAKVRDAASPTESVATETGAAENTERHPHLKHLDRVLELDAIIADDAATAGARKAAKAELAKLRKAGEKLNAEKDAPATSTAEQDAEMKARIQARRAKRGAQGSPENTRQMQQDVADANSWLGPDDVAAARAKKAAQLTLADVTPDAEPATVAPEPAAPEVEPAAPEVEPAAPDAEPATAARAVDKAVEGFAKPSEAPKVDFETNGLGQYKIKRPSDGRMVGYTRVTTYIDALEDKSALTKWKMRILLEGVAAAEEPDESGQQREVTGRVRDLVHNRDVAIAKARKADRKGKLEPGQLAAITDGAWSTFKKALDTLADEVFEIGGGRAAAQKGTDIHALCDLHDSEGIDAVQDLLDAGEISPSDFADVEAYARAIKALGLKVLASEQVIVNDELGVAGRLDRVYFGKLPEIRDPKTKEIIRAADSRARRYIGDVKTGNIEYGAGKIAQQLRMYADGEAYDLNTHERTKHGANRSAGLVIHLPAGSGKATVHLVNLDTGAQGNKLAGEVRAFRNTGRKAITSKVDLVDVASEQN